MVLFRRLLVFILVPQLALAQVPQVPFELPVNPAVLPETALVLTSKGDFVIEFFRSEAPITVRNFVYLTEKQFYEGLTFHKYHPGFIVQGGDPLGNGKGGPGWTLPAEFSANLKHRSGTIGVPRIPSVANPRRESNGSQFYITLGKHPHLDGFYTVFAKVKTGMENVRKLREGDKIIKVKLPKDWRRKYRGEVIEDEVAQKPPTRVENKKEEQSKEVPNSSKPREEKGSPRGENFERMKQPYVDKDSYRHPMAW